MPHRAMPRRGHSLDILGQNIKLQVNERSGLRVLQIRYPPGVGNDPDGKVLRPDFGDRKADSIDGDRPFVSDQMGKFSREFHLQSKVFFDRFEGQDLGDGIDMSLDEMASEARVASQWPLEINQALAAQVFQVR